MDQVIICNYDFIITVIVGNNGSVIIGNDDGITSVILRNNTSNNE